MTKLFESFFKSEWGAYRSDLWSESVTIKQMKFYVACAIPYVNDKPHLGHAILQLYGDVLARYHRQLGDEVLFSCGADEHGGKIIERAAELKITPKQLADQMSQSFIDLLKVLNISNDRFIRTTDPAHEKRAQIIWKNLTKYIYKGVYEGWYCTGCETFYTDEVVKQNKGVCPLHNRPYEKLKEENYFFKLSAFTTKIQVAVETGKLKILPTARQNEILSVLKMGLEDISVSRPKDKIGWGVPVPGDPTQVMYVWFEALMNYITVLGYPEHPDFEKFWPCDVQVIGKDILRFHAAIWPAMHLGLGIPMPQAVYAHGFITSGGKKMSKTLGNVVDPVKVIKDYTADAFRYYFLRYGPASHDTDFTWEHFKAAYNNELADQLGNAVSRTSAMIAAYQNGLIGDIPDPEHDIASYTRALSEYRFDKAMEEVWEQVRGLNQYIDEAKPWNLANPKSGTRDEEHLREVLAYMTGCLIEIADLLVPMLPDTSAKIKQVFASGVLRPLAASLFPKTVEGKKS